MELARSARLLAVVMLAVVSGFGCGSSTPVKEARRAPKGSYAFWPQAPDEPRIQFIRSISSSEDVSPTQTSGLEKVVFGENAAKPNEIVKPYGVAMRDGKIYVCDIRAAAVVVFDLRKKQTRLVGTTGANRLDHPVAVAVADDGMLYVADNNRGAIVVFDAEERYSTTIGTARSRPASLATHGDRLYVADMASQVIQVFNRKTGSQEGVIGAVGDQDGQFRLPIGVATDAEGDIWVVDMMRCRVQKFDADGKFLLGVGALGDYAGSFARPKHLAVDRDGVVYVVDAAFQNVQMFDAQGRLLMAFGAAGDFPGAMNLPAGICVAEDSNDLFSEELHPGFASKRVVVVTNQFGASKVSLYAMGGRRDGYTVQDLASAAVVVKVGVGGTEGQRKLQEQGEGDEPLPAGPSGPEAAPAEPQAPAGPAAPEAPKTEPKRN